jgi:preprotein translocase subunit SecA
MRAEDCVWMSRAAMRKGVAREVHRLAQAGRSVLVCVFRLSEVDDWHAELAADHAERCRDAFKHDALLRQLETPGAVTVALTGALPGTVKDGAGGVEILVCGRNESRKADDAVLAIADLLGARARVTFHLSLDDPVLQKHAGSIKPLMEKLGASEDEPISHAFVTRAIAQAQAKHDENEGRVGIRKS